MAITFTKKGLDHCREVFLKAYYHPEKREEIIKIAKVLEIDIEEIKNSFIKKALNLEEPAAKATAPTKMGFSEKGCLIEGSHIFDDLLKELKEKGVQNGQKLKITIETENSE